MQFVPWGATTVGRLDLSYQQRPFVFEELSQQLEAADLQMTIQKCLPEAALTQTLEEGA